MIFNGIEKEYIRVLSDLFRPPTPPIEFNENGSRKKFTDTILPVPVRIMSDNNIEFLKENMAEWLYHKEPKKLVFKQIPDRFYFAEYAGMQLVERGKFATGTIDFYLKDPYRYSAEKQLSATGTHEIKGHKSTNWRTKTTFTANQTGYELQFNLPGKTALKDICKIKLNYEFKSGDILECRYKKRRITVNGKDITNSLVILQSNFKELPVGPNIEFTASHKTDVFYHERYY